MTLPLKSLPITPSRVQATWALSGGASGSTVVFTVVADRHGQEGVVIRHHCYPTNPKSWMTEFCVSDGNTVNNVAVRATHIVPMDIARKIWDRFIQMPHGSSESAYRQWVKVSPDMFTVPPDEFIAHFASLGAAR
jgi:hypothetical protein